MWLNIMWFNKNSCTKYYFIVFYLQTFKLQFVFTEYQATKECHPDAPDVHGKYLEAFERMGDKSKYGYRKKESDDKLKSFEDGKKWCEENGMQLAMITTDEDYKSINKYLIGKHPNCTEYQWVWLIAPFRKIKEEIWWDSDINATKFQMFLGFEPYQGVIPKEYDRDYSVLMCSSKSKNVIGSNYALAYRDTPHHWNLYLGLICQFKEKTTCFKKSDENKRNAKRSKTKKFIGDSKTRKYYIGPNQKTFKDAEAECSKDNMKLLDLEFTKKKEAKRLHKWISNYITSKDLFASATSFFLSGEFSQLFQGDEYVPFEFEWADFMRERNVENYAFNYFETGHSKLGKCLSIGVLYSETIEFTISAADCNSLHWVICYKAKKNASLKNLESDVQNKSLTKRGFHRPTKIPYVPSGKFKTGGFHRSSKRFDTESGEVFDNPKDVIERPSRRISTRRDGERENIIQSPTFTNDEDDDLIPGLDRDNNDDYDNSIEEEEYYDYPQNTKISTNEYLDSGEVGEEYRDQYYEDQTPLPTR